MTWVKIDDGYADHPKHAEAGPLGQALWLAGLAYCNKNLTDGFIPWAHAQRLVCWKYLAPPDDQGRRVEMTIGVTSGHHGEDVTTEAVITLLIHSGLWEERDGGYFVHDYPEYQPTKEEVLALRSHLKRESSNGGKARMRTAVRVGHGRFGPITPPADAAGEPPAGPAGPPPADAAGQPPAGHQPTRLDFHQPEHQPRTRTRSPSESTKSATEGTPTEPSPAGVASQANGTGNRKDLTTVLDTAQKVRAALLVEALLKATPKPGVTFKPYACLQRMTAAGLPVDQALQVLHGIKERWDAITNPWAYAQTVLDKEYASYRINLAIAQHERVKRAPVNMTRLNAIFNQAATTGKGGTPR